MSEGSKGGERGSYHDIGRSVSHLQPSTPAPGHLSLHCTPSSHSGPHSQNTQNLESKTTLSVGDIAD
jgi:hypothetical protein